MWGKFAWKKVTKRFKSIQIVYVEELENKSVFLKLGFIKTTEMGQKIVL